ncbi:hypothetical protein ACSBR2_002094 [Camellia fascicularis]
MNVFKWDQVAKRGREVIYFYAFKVHGSTTACMFKMTIRNFLLLFVGPRNLNKTSKGKQVVEVDDDDVDEEEEIENIEQVDVGSEDDELIDVLDDDDRTDI